MGQVFQETQAETETQTQETMKTLIHFIIRSICVWAIIWSIVSMIVTFSRPECAYFDSVDTWRFIFGTLLPWVATCIVAKRYLEDKKAGEPTISLVSCRATTKDIDIILLNSSVSYVNVIEWAYKIGGQEILVSGDDESVPRHKGIHRFSAKLPCDYDNPPKINQVRVWTAQMKHPCVFLPPFDCIEP